MSRTLLTTLILFISFYATAQDDADSHVLDSHMPPVTAADFSPVSPLVDANTDAVVLLDSGASTLDASLEDGFFIRYYKFRRILIRNKTVLDQLSKNTLYYSAHMNDGKKLKTIRINTYNLENGKVVKTVAQDNDFFLEQSKGDIKSVKFTYPNMKEGSIIEMEYYKRMNSTDLEDWYFQGEFPKLKSVYTVTLPDLFNFSIQFRNKKYLTSTKKSELVKSVFSSNFEYLNSTITTISWTFENVPPMREEPFTSTVDNFLACVKFQISARPVRPGVTRTLLRDWQEVCNNILNSESFGSPISSPASFLKKQANQFTEGKSTELQKAMAIYAGVRDHFQVDGRGVFSSDDKPLTDIYKSGTGNVGSINMILIAMMRTQKIQADPVILATRDKGVTNQAYPLLDNYNYLICRVKADNKIYFLDASDATMGFGKIPLSCYNGHARVVTYENFPIFLAPDSVRETKMITTNIRNDNNGKMILSWADHAGYYESSDLRSVLKSKTTEDVFKELTQTTPNKKSLDSFYISDLKNMDEPVVLHYTMTLEPARDARIYFNPFLNMGLTENPFKSATRSYPVEMSYVTEKSFILDMEIPTGYEIDELPKSQKFLLNETEGSYDYQIETAGNKIKIKSSMILSKAIFEPEDYNSLKDFYAAIIKKQNEIIVFRKKN
jgi:Domain of Unknown Function with PDB structure (DUF3857)/Domain of Unknown Function with PDB structure (DUF3858)/Transglutaminase-like superfamily